jgi:hypothetical protein
VRKNVLEFTKGMPEVLIGNALIAEVSLFPLCPLELSQCANGKFPVK